jgi:hypothetical protein
LSVTSARLWILARWRGSWRRRRDSVTEEELKIAKRAYINLLTGKMARVHVDQNGERVEFAAINHQALLNLIRMFDPEWGRTFGANRPARFMF